MRPNILHISCSALCLLPALTACDPKLNLGELFGDDSTASTSGSSTSSTSGISTSSTSDGSTASTSDSSTASTSDGSTTAAPETTTGDSSGGSSSDDTGEPTTCDIWTQNCPANEKCSPYDNGGDDSWDALKCVPPFEPPHNTRNARQMPSATTRYTGPH